VSNHESFAGRATADFVLRSSSWCCRRCRVAGTECMLEGSPVCAKLNGSTVCCSAQVAVLCRLCWCVERAQIAVN
jgi:hypothetical protein